MIEYPTKIFPCECMGEGLIVKVETEGDDYFVNISFWEYGHCIEGKWSWWWRLKIAWHIFRKGTPWSDMVIMRPKVAKNFAYHILYLIDKNKNRSVQVQKPLVKIEDESL